MVQFELNMSVLDNAGFNVWSNWHPDPGEIQIASDIYRANHAGNFAIDLFRQKVIKNRSARAAKKPVTKAARLHANLLTKFQKKMYLQKSQLLS